MNSIINRSSYFTTLRATNVAVGRVIKYRILLSFLLSGMLVSCASITAQPELAVIAGAGQVATEQAPQPLNEPQNTPSGPQQIKYGAFAEDDLYKAIIGEMEAHRGELDNAGENYFDLAMSTRDLGIIRRAIQFASVTDNSNSLMQLGLLWAEVAPAEPEPHLLLSFQFLEAGSFEQALSHMEQVIELGGAIDFAALSGRTGRVDPRMRTQLIDSLQRLSNSYPSDESITIALIQLLDQSQRSDEALTVLENYKQRADESSTVALIEAQLLQQLEQGKQALRVLKRAVRQYPDDKNLRFNYARLLIQNEEFSDAQRQFGILVEQDPDDYETYYSIALLNLEMENYDSAASDFQRLIAADHRADESHYYLGLTYERQQEPEKAIEQFRQVRIGTSNFLAAQQQATRFSIELERLDQAHEWLQKLSEGQPRLEVLFNSIESSALIQEGHYDRARSLLDQALDKFPNDVDLLFARVLLFDSLMDRESSESDLRQIISLQPDDARALNHLGYMLADQTTRYDEALALIERAIAISPNDPAIIDSLAWAQYKLGNFEHAEQNLRRAFAVFPDPEVASHLGEVLWQMGRREEATQVWQDALEQEPDSEILKTVIEKFVNSSRQS